MMQQVWPWILIFGPMGIFVRYFSDILWKTKSTNFPISTFIVNVVGAFLAGMLYTQLQKKEFPPQIIQGMLIGFCGGLTTFSSFSLQGMNLLSKGEIFLSLFYLIGSLILGVFAAYLGIKIS